MNLFAKRMKRYCVGAVLLTAMTFFAGACKNDLAEVEALVSSFNTQVETAKDVEILYSDSARIKVRIQGATMLNHLDRSEPRQEFPDGVVVSFYGPEGEVASTLTAKYGVRFQSKGLVIVRDSVVWQSIENEKLETEELQWDEREKKIFTNKFVVITRPDEIIYGHGFEADQDFRYSRINAIEGQIKADNLETDLE